MKKSNVIRAWKDPEYRASLSDQERASLPDNPAGMIDVSEQELGIVDGGRPGGGNFVALMKYTSTNDDCYAVDLNPWDDHPDWSVDFGRFQYGINRGG